MSGTDAASVAARFVAAQESLLTAIERAGGDGELSPQAADALERASARCEAAFGDFRALLDAGAPLPVGTVNRARHLSALLSATAQSRSSEVADSLDQARAHRRALGQAPRGAAGLGGSCDIAG